MFNPQTLKKDFPLFERRINGKVLTYLDNASTSQKPRAVIDALSDYYRNMNANTHRGIHTLSEEATAAYEMTREKVAKFIHALESAEIIFTRNATESINLVAYTWGEMNITEGDEIVVSALEHHSNLVPWQELCRRKKAVLKIIPLNLESALLDLSDLNNIITERTKLVAITQMSNVLGTIVPLNVIGARARKVGAKFLVDACQSAPHLKIDVQKIDCDFLAFSSHKMLGPTGVGVLYGKRELLENMPPFLFGGNMISEVKTYESKWSEIPWKFEAGTSNIADVIAFAKAIEYLENIGMDNILLHDQKLLAYARKKLGELSGISLYGSTDISQSGGILAFNIPGVHPHDVGSIVNEEGVAIRAGHHCAEPLHALMGTGATARMSFYLYNDESDIDRAFEALKKVYEIFKIP